jgi:hypothetical protein
MFNYYIAAFSSLNCFNAHKISFKITRLAAFEQPHHFQIRQSENKECLIEFFFKTKYHNSISCALIIQP